MNGEGQHFLANKSISNVERRRREVAINYARASVGLEGFTLSVSDEAHALHFINGAMSLSEFVQLRPDALICPKA